MPAVNTLVGDGAPDFYGYNDADAAAAHLGDPAYDASSVGRAGGSAGAMAGATNVHVAGFVILALALIVVFHRQGFRGINV